jgi:alkyldihydroxyacetonephosphate synthase
LGLDAVKIPKPAGLSASQLARFRVIAGEEFVRTDGYARLSASYGKSVYDLLRMRNKIAENIPDAVIYPDSREQIEAIVSRCASEKIPLYVCGGGTSLTRGTECVRGGVSLDMRLRFNKAVGFNEVDQSVTVEAGMSGSKLETLLNNAEKEFGGKRPYTCGHFPRSFGHSTVGGWVMTGGSGRDSGYYGGIRDIVLGGDYATPSGAIFTSRYSNKAAGPDLCRIMAGSEGAFGVLTHVTLKVFRRHPDARRFACVFKDWETAQAAAREIMQAGEGFPPALRLSDPEETGVLMRVFEVTENPLGRLLEARGFRFDKMCLLEGWVGGSRGLLRGAPENERKVAARFGAFRFSGIAARLWEKYQDSVPYFRDAVQDFGFVLDTLECGVSWSNMGRVYRELRAYAGGFPRTLCMTRVEHMDPQGADLCLTFITRMRDPEEYRKFHAGFMDLVARCDACISGHYGIGKLSGPWLEGYLGRNEYAVIRALKRHFDPGNIMNPGGTLGLDLDGKDRHFWG